MILRLAVELGLLWIVFTTNGGLLEICVDCWKLRLIANVLLPVWEPEQCLSAEWTATVRSPAFASKPSVCHLAS